MASQHCLSYSPASAPGSAGSVDCSKVIGCLTPGSVPTSALAPGPLPTGVTIAATEITGVIAPANLPPAIPTTHTSSWDPVNNTLTTIVDGVTATAILGSLDDEGVELAIVAGVLQLKNKAGVVIGSVPIVDQDAQTLSLAATPAKIDITISGSNSTVSITCKEIGALFSVAAIEDSISGTTAFLTNKCKAFPIANIAKAVLGRTTNVLDYYPATGLGGAQLASTVNDITSLVPIAAIVSCTNVSTAFDLPPQAATASDVVLGKDCKSFKISSFPITDSQITYANPAAVGSTGLLSIGGQTIQLIHPISSLGTIRTDYWAFA